MLRILPEKLTCPRRASLTVPLRPNCPEAFAPTVYSLPSRVRMAVIQAVLPFSKSQPELVATCATLRMTSVGLLIVREAEFSPSTPPRLSPHAYRSPSSVRQNR